MTSPPPNYTVPDCEICGAKGIGAFGLGALHVCINCALGNSDAPSFGDATVVTVLVNGEPARTDGITVRIIGPDGQPINSVSAFPEPPITPELRKQVIREWIGQREPGSYFLLGNEYELMDVTEMVQSAINAADDRRDGGC